MSQSDQRHEIDLPAGRVRYREAGEGKPVVFVHGFLVDGRLWDGVVDRLSDRFRCIAPDWPIGAQQIAMKPDADLSPPGIAAIDRQLPRGARARRRDNRRQRLRRGDVAGSRHPPPRADRPPRADQLRHPRELPAGDLQGDAAARQAARRDDRALGAVPDRRPRPRRLQALRQDQDPGRPDRLLDGAQPERPSDQARRDQGDGRDEQALHAGGGGEASSSDLPILLTWAPGDKFFPLKYAERLARETPNARMVQIPGAGTFVALDQPQRLADEIASFVEAN